MVDIFCGPCIKGNSPGTLTGNRLAIENNTSIFIASHHQVINVKIKYPEKLKNLKQEPFDSLNTTKLESHLENEIVDLKYDSSKFFVYLFEN